MFHNSLPALFDHKHIQQDLHSMPATAHFILIYILKSPPTHDQYLLTLKDDPTVLIKFIPVQTGLLIFNTKEHLKFLVSYITVFTKLYHCIY